jgi:transcriptional regulator with XRE-family HTH domain
MARRKSVGPTDTLNLVGPKLRDMRETAGLKGVELAARLSLNGWPVKPVILSLIENRRRTLTDVEIARILEVLDCSWSDLEKN